MKKCKTHHHQVSFMFLHKKKNLKDSYSLLNMSVDYILLLYLIFNFSAATNMRLSCHELGPVLPEDLTVAGPEARSFSSLWTRSCKLALSRSKVWIVPWSVLTEPLSPRSTASCEDNNPCYSILDKILLFNLKTMLWQYYTLILETQTQ